MSCTVTKVILDNGEESKLFNDLISVMEPAAALENYLELTSNIKGYSKVYGQNTQGEVDGSRFKVTPKFKEAEFKSYQQQIDVYDMLTDEFLEMLKVEEKTTSRSSLTGINLNGLTNNPAILNNVIVNVKRNIQAEVSSNNYPPEQAKMMLLGAENLRRYIATPGKDKSSILGPIGQRLANYGIHIKVNPKENPIDSIEDSIEDQNGVVDSEKIQTEYQRIYSMSILETSATQSILDQLKIYLRGVKKVADDYTYQKDGGNIKYEVSDIGSLRPARYEVLVGKLYGTLKGAQSVAEIKQKIEKALPTSPELAPIYKDLINEKPSVFKGIGNYNKLSTALYSLAKQDYNMVSFVEAINGDVYTSNSNAYTVKTLTVSRWEENVNQIQKEPRTKLAKNLDAFISNPRLKRALNVKDNNGNYLLPSSYFAAAATHFHNAGFTGVTKDVLKQAVQEVLDNPLLLLKKSIAPTPYNVLVDGLLKTLPTKVLNKKRDHLSVFSNDIKRGSESKTLNFLANITSKNIPDAHVGAFLGGKGTMIHPYNLGSQAQDTFSVLTGNTEISAEYMQDFAGDPMYADTQIMKIMSDEEFSLHKENFQIQTLDTLKNNNSNNGVGYGNLSSFDALISRINSFFSPQGSKNYFQVFSPTQADRGNLTLLTVPKMNLKYNATDGQLNDIIFKGNEVVSEDIKDWIKNQVRSELKRILTAKSIGGYKNYSSTDTTSGNASRFNLFTTLNETFDASKLTQRNLESIVEDLSISAEKEFITSIQEDIEYLVDQNIIEADSSFIKFTKEAKKGLAGFAKSPSIKKADLETFLANNFIYNYEQILFFLGDPAFYKEGSDAAQKVDINKRMALPYTPGVKLATGAGTGMPATFKVKVISEPKHTSEIQPFLKALTGTGKYVDTEIADGYGIASIDRVKRTLLAQGKQNDSILKLLTELENWKPGKRMPKADDIAHLLTSLKAFYFKIKKDDNGIMVPTSLKYSIFPAIPPLMEATVNGKPKFPTLDKISKELRSGRADEIVVPSAVKVGIRDVGVVDNLENIAPIVLDNDAVRHPQPPSDKLKVEDTLGSQMRKLIIGNFLSASKMLMTRFGKSKEPVNSDIALDHYNTALSNIVTTKAREVETTFLNEDGTANTQEITSKLLENVDESTYQSSGYYRNALGSLQEEGSESLLPLHYPTIRPKLDNMLNSYFRKAVNKLKMPGHSAVQISSFGTAAMTTDGTLSTNSDLKFVGFADVNGNRIDHNSTLGKDLIKASKRKNTEDLKLLEKYVVAPAEVRVSPSFFIGRLKEIAADRAKRNKKLHEEARTFRSLAPKGPTQKIAYNTKLAQLITAETENQFNRMLAFISNPDGSFNTVKIKEAGLDEVVLYRIPTQAKNSMLVATIKEFLPPNSVNTIQVPGEVVDQSGSDFDIDKVFIEMHDFTVDENNNFIKKAFLNEEGQIDTTPEKIGGKYDYSKAHAYIMEFHKAVLSAPQYITELVTPNNVDTLKQIVEDFNVSEEAISGNLVSVKVQETFRNNNKSGKDLISIASISSVMHSVAQQIGAEFFKPIRIGGKKIKLGELTNHEGKLISDEIAEIQNAALDNSKEPLLGLLNIDEFTASTALLLVSGGYGLKFATAVLNAPIIRDLASVYPRYSRLNSARKAKEMAFSHIKKKYGIKRNTANAFDLNGFTEGMALNLMNPTSVQDHATSLKAFELLQSHGEALARFQRTMNIDSKGVPSSTGKLFDLYENMAGIPGTKANRRELTNEGLLKDVQRFPNVEFSKIKIDSSKYDKSHLSSMEDGSLYQPLKVNKAASPSASVQMQRVLSKAKDAFGFIDENRQVNILSAYDTFLALNSNSSEVSTSDLAKAVSNGDFKYLTDIKDSNATANLLKSYRRSLPEGSKENQFTENLMVETDKDSGRVFVKFRNSVARATSAEVKDDMLEFYNELLFSDVPLERKLARSLANYAMVNYGYETSLNSFMSLIPPQAHTEFMVGLKSKDPVTLPDHFRAIQLELNNSRAFSEESIDNFLDLYVSNNAHKLKIQTEFSPSNIQEVPQWIQDEQREIGLSDPANPYTPSRYIKVFNEKGEVNIFKWKPSAWAPTKLDRKGIPNLVSEYHLGESAFHKPVKSISMETTTQKDNTSAENKQVLENINKEQFLFTDVAAKVGDIDALPIKNRKQAEEYIERVMSHVIATGELSNQEVIVVREILDSSIKSGERRLRFDKKKGIKGNNFEVAFKEKYKADAVDLLNTLFASILNKKLC